MLHANPTTIIPVTSSNGDTFLHIAIRNCKNADELISFLKSLDFQYVSRMAKMTNDQGMLPYEHIKFLNMSRVKIHALMDIIISYTRELTPKSMSEPLDYKAVKTTYGTSGKSILNAYLKLGCYAVNETRKIYLYSSTHPEHSGKTADLMIPIDQEINTLRKQTSANRKVITAEITKKYRTSIKERLFKELLANQISSEKSRYGNCFEQAYSAYNLIINKNKFVSAAIYRIVGGDHAFVIIDPQGYKVLVDPWSGIVCPGTDIASQRLNYKNCVYNPDNSLLASGMINYSFLGSFNPACHSIEPAKLFSHYPQVLDQKLSEYPISLTDHKNEPLQIPLEVEINKSRVDLGFYRNLFERAILELLISADRVAHLYVLMTPSGRVSLENPAVCKAIQEQTLNDAVKDLSPIYHLTSTIDGIQLLFKYTLLINKINHKGLNACDNYGCNVLINLVSNQLGCQLLSDNQKLCHLITNEGLFSKVTSSGNLDINGKCAADFLIAPENIKLSKQMSKDIQSSLSEYKEKKLKRLYLFSSGSRHSVPNDQKSVNIILTPHSHP